MNTKKIKEIQKLCREFFELTDADKVPDPPIKFLFTRAEMDEFTGRKTEDWVRATTHSRGLAFIDESVLEDITPHKKGDFWKVVHHEMSHWYFDHIVGRYNGEPIWFVEGLAEHMAGQKTYLPVETDENVCAKHYSSCDQQTYRWGILMVNKLVRDYGKDKLLEMIKYMGPDMTEKGFAKDFNKVYGISILDFETEVKQELEIRWEKARENKK
ncbi:MAG: hypothetical protein WCP14_01875 [bacterium]